ncbi:MAG: DUF1761 domain-containing protein [Chloroflexi bacterium]|nr:DUF1761 domain-containing protein [Chloroflexota bacterium]
MSFAELQPVPIAIATVVGFIALFVLYLPPILGNPWGAQVRAYTGATDQQLQGSLAKGIAIWVAGTLVNAIVLDVLIVSLDVRAALDGAIVGAVLWAGVAAPFSAWSVGFARQPVALWGINNVAFLILELIMGAVLAAMR